MSRVVWFKIAVMLTLVPVFMIGIGLICKVIFNITVAMVVTLLFLILFVSLFFKYMDNV